MNELSDIHYNKIYYYLPSFIQISREIIFFFIEYTSDQIERSESVRNENEKPRNSHNKFSNINIHRPTTGIKTILHSL